MWNGMFGPVHPELIKHRLYTGDISNHITVDIEEIDSEPDDDFERTKLDSSEIDTGDGGMHMFLVRVRFIGGETLYEYILETDNPDPSIEDLKHAVSHDINPEE